MKKKSIKSTNFNAQARFFFGAPLPQEVHHARRDARAYRIHTAHRHRRTMPSNADSPSPVKGLRACILPAARRSLAEPSPHAPGPLEPRPAALRLLRLSPGRMTRRSRRWTSSLPRAGLAWLAPGPRPPSGTSYTHTHTHTHTHTYFHLTCRLLLSKLSASTPLSRHLRGGGVKNKTYIQTNNASERVTNA